MGKRASRLAVSGKKTDIEQATAVMEKAKTEKWSDFEDAHLRLSKGCHGKSKKLKHGVILKAPICF